MTLVRRCSGSSTCGSAEASMHNLISHQHLLSNMVRLSSILLVRSSLSTPGVDLLHCDHSCLHECDVLLGGNTAPAPAPAPTTLPAPALAAVETPPPRCPLRFGGGSCSLAATLLPSTCVRVSPFCDGESRRQGNRGKSDIVHRDHIREVPIAMHM